MTRINLVPVEALSDQHLFTEWRELPRLATALKKRLSKSDFEQNMDHYVLGTGHMIFFYDKMKYLSKRHKQLTKELKRRSYTLKTYKNDPFLDTSPQYHKDFRPRPKEVNSSIQRIQEKLEQRPEWYRYYGEIKSPTFFKRLMK